MLVLGRMDNQSIIIHSDRLLENVELKVTKVWTNTITLEITAPRSVVATYPMSVTEVEVGQQVTLKGPFDGGDVEVKVLRIDRANGDGRGQVKIGIAADRSVAIDREEIYIKKQLGKQV